MHFLVEMREGSIVVIVPSKGLYVEDLRGRNRMSYQDMERFYSLSTAYQEAVGKASQAHTREEYLRWHLTGERLIIQIDRVLHRS